MTESKRELGKSVLFVLQRISDRADREWQQGRDLSPRNGMIPAGSGHIRPQALCDALRMLSKAFCDGKTAEEAVAIGNARADEWADNWNSKRERQVHIAHGVVDPVLWYFARELIQAEESDHRRPREKSTE